MSSRKTSLKSKKLGKNPLQVEVTSQAKNTSIIKKNGEQIQTAVTSQPQSEQKETVIVVKDSQITPTKRPFNDQSVTPSPKKLFWGSPETPSSSSSSSEGNI